MSVAVRRTIARQIGLTDVRLDTLDAEFTGDTACEVGEATLTTTGGTAVVKYVVVWKRAVADAETPI
jgi:hypothetical protein